MMSSIDSDGLPYIGQRVHPDEPLYSTHNTLTSTTKSTYLKDSEGAIIDSVSVDGTGSKNYLQKVHAMKGIEKIDPKCSPLVTARRFRKTVISKEIKGLVEKCAFDGIDIEDLGLVVANPRACTSCQKRVDLEHVEDHIICKSFARYFPMFSNTILFPTEFAGVFSSCSYHQIQGSFITRRLIH